MNRRIELISLMMAIAMGTSCGQDEEEPINEVFYENTDSHMIKFSAPGGGFHEFIEVGGSRYEFVREYSPNMTQLQFLNDNTGQYFTSPVPFTIVFKKNGCEERSVTIQPCFDCIVQYYVNSDSIAYKIR